jgi:hypothetical protein
MDQVGTGTSIRVKCNFTDASHPNGSPPYGERTLSKKESTGSNGSTRAGSCHVRRTFASACHRRGKASNSNGQSALRTLTVPILLKHARQKQDSKAVMHSACFLFA